MISIALLPLAVEIFIGNREHLAFRVEGAKTDSCKNEVMFTNCCYIKRKDNNVKQAKSQEKEDYGAMVQTSDSSGP